MICVVNRCKISIFFQIIDKNKTHITLKYIQLKPTVIFISQWPLILYVIDFRTKDLMLLFQMYLEGLENYSLQFGLELVHHLQYMITEFSFLAGSNNKSYYISIFLVCQVYLIFTKNIAFYVTYKLLPIYCRVE